MAVSPVLTLRHRSALTIGAVLVAVAAVFAAVIVPMSAQAATVALSGVVIGPKGTPMAGLAVIAVAYPSETETTTTTSASGAFTFPALDTGNYTLRFPKTSTTYAQYFGGITDINQVQLFTLQTNVSPKAYLKVLLEAAGTVGGKVTRTSGAAIRGYTVRAYEKDVAGDWVVAATTKTSSTGAYSLSGLKPGPFRLEVRDATSLTPAYAPQFSGGATSITQASEIVVLASKTTPYSFKLGSAGKVTGTVLGEFGGGAPEKLAGVVVTPYHFVGPAGGGYTGVEALTAQARTTSSTGAYTLTGLAPGEYILKFTPRLSAPLPLSGTKYSTAFLGNAPGPLDGTPFTLTAGATASGKNITLVDGGSLYGEILDASQLPTQVGIRDLRVWIERAGDDPFDGLHTPRTTLTDAVGHYEFDGLQAGVYDVYAGGLVDEDLDDGIEEDTSWLRAKTGTVTIDPGEDELERFPVTPKDPQGLHLTGGPIVVANSGTLQVGSSVSVPPGVWNYGGTGTQTYTYEWFRGSTAIPDATDQFYYFVPGDVGHSIFARVTVHDFGYGSAYEYSNNVGPILEGDAPLPAGPGPSIAGDPAVGSTVTAQTGAWTAFGVDPAVQADPGILWSFAWQVSPDFTTWSTIGSGKTHLVTSDDYVGGPHLRVVLHGQRQGYADVTYPVNAVDIVPGTYVATTPPKVTKAGTTLGVDVGTWTPALTPMPFAFTWTVYENNGTFDNSNHTPTQSLAGNAGKYITVSVAPNMPSVNGVPIVLVAQKGATITGDLPLTLNGVAQVGDILVASSVTWSTPPDSISYQWQYLKNSTWVTVPGASSNGYIVEAEYLGKRLRVIQTAVKAGYGTAVRTSPQSAVVIAGTAPVVVPGAEPILGGGAVATNNLVTLDAGAWTPAPSSFSYTWKISPNPVGGPFTTLATTTTPSLLIPSGIEGNYLSVDVVAKLPGRVGGVYPLALGQVMQGVLVPKVKPVISHVGSAYKVTNGTWSPSVTVPPGGYSYDWRVYSAAGVPSSSSSSSSFNVSATPNAPVDVQVTATMPTEADGHSGYIMAKLGTFVPTGPLTVDVTTSTVDSPFDAHLPSGFGPTAAAKSYQWQYKKGSVWTNIGGQDASQMYVTGSALVGKQVRVGVTVKNPLYTTATFYSSNTVVVGTAAAATPGIPPSFDGPAAIGQKITADPGVWSDSATTYTYQWQQSPDGVAPYVDITGATGAGYTPPASLHGHSLRVIVKHVWSGHLTGSTSRDAGVVGDGTIVNVTKPKVSKSGSTLTVSTGTWKVSGLTFTYVWRVLERNGSSSVVSTSKNYVIAGSDAGKLIQVEVDVSKLSYLPNSSFVNARPGTVIAPTAPITVSGNLVDGSMLTANVPGFDVSLPTIEFQWYRNGIAIPFENLDQYTQGPDDIAKALSVKVTASHSGYPSYVKTIVLGPTLSQVIPASVTPPVVNAGVSGTGNARVGTAMTATPGTWSVPGLAYTYQWYRSSVAIAGATASTYLPVPTDLFSEIWVVVTASKAKTYSPASERSESHTVDYGKQPVMLTPADFSVSGIGGTGLLNGTLTAATVTFDIPVSVDYFWQYRSLGDPGWTTLSASNSYTPTVADGMAIGTDIRLFVTAYRPGYSGAGFSSNIITLH